MSRSAMLAAVVTTVACASGPPTPAELDTSHEQCGRCRMAVSDVHFAGQVGAPGELPRFFDDIGCLAGWLKEEKALPEGIVVWVADHRTGEWVPAGAAVYTRVPALATPMSSHLIAHADAASRDADPDSGGGTPVAAAELFEPVIVSGGTR